MHLELTCPPIYNFRNDDGSIGGEGWEQVHRWGWCNVGELLHYIHVEYQLKWKREEFFRRFWCGPKSMDNQNRPIICLLRTNGKFEFFRKLPSNIVSTPSKRTSVFVPAGFAKGVLYEIGRNGGRKVVATEHGPALADEVGNIICQY